MKEAQAHPESMDTARSLDDVVVGLGTGAGTARQPRVTSSPQLAAVCAAGTRHIYADTADFNEVGALVTTSDGAIVREVDGSTANQPLVRKVIERYLQSNDVTAWVRQLRAQDLGLTNDALIPLLYAIVCGRIGSDVVQAFAAGRPWEVSLQLHMQLGYDAEAAKRVGRMIRRMVPSAVVKVPFMPQAPACFLIARDLENEGIPVNFTSTFSARQTVVAGLLSNVTLTNIFMGRLNQGLKATLLGEHVDLAAQRWLRQLRQIAKIKTLLIVASVREWQTFVRVAGCDCFTSPCEAIRGLMTQTEVAPAEIKSQLETSYEDRLGVADDAMAALGAERIARTYKVEPELVQFLSEFRATREYAALRDGDQLFKHFDRAGFGDIFYAPTATEWQELRKNKLPDFASPLTKRLPIDTLFTLLADADFEKYQEEMNTLLLARLPQS